MLRMGEAHRWYAILTVHHHATYNSVSKLATIILLLVSHVANQEQSCQKGN
jgi:hypothetical protein